MTFLLIIVKKFIKSVTKILQEARGKREISHLLLYPVIFFSNLDKKFQENENNI